MTTAALNETLDGKLGIQQAPPIWLIRCRLGLMLVGAIAAPIFYPPNVQLLLLFFISYVVRMFGAEAVYHRYFAHRAYRTSRAMQFILCLIGVQAAQRGPLWWAYTHNIHHRHTDKPGDLHSPVVGSFRLAHSGWFMDERYIDTNLDMVRHYAKFPELRWINVHYFAVISAVAALLFIAGHYSLLGKGISGMAAVCWGACLPIILGIQAFSLVNSTAHGRRFPGGSRRYRTDDESLNRPILALLTLGTGWHNNHHRYAAAGRAGFAWYEVDVCYYLLRALASFGLITDLRPVPERILIEGGLRGGEVREEVPNSADSEIEHRK
jgi:stearoyl-CoA desaturase (Delta-9 desaturase)